jgi:RNA polymerase sigma factor (sigma-70 family)
MIQYPDLAVIVKVKKPGLYRAALAVGIDHEEIRQIAWQGAIRSAATYDRTITGQNGKVASFATYAFKSIMNHVGRATEVANQRQFRTPTGGKISGDAPFRESRPGKSRNIWDDVGDTRPHPTDDPVERDRLATVKARIADALRKLPNRLRTIVEMRWGLNGNDPLTLEEAGQALHITRERVRQLEKRAMERIRIPLAISSHSLLGDE